MMSAEPANELSVDEATQYDRQIRLWGVDAQKRYYRVHGTHEASSRKVDGCLPNYHIAREAVVTISLIIICYANEETKGFYEIVTWARFW